MITDLQSVGSSPYSTYTDRLCAREAIMILFKLINNLLLENVEQPPFFGLDWLRGSLRHFYFYYFFTTFLHLGDLNLTAQTKKGTAYKLMKLHAIMELHVSSLIFMKVHGTGMQAHVTACKLM